MAKLKLIKKLNPFTAQSTLELAVKKTGGPVSTAVEVGSTGSDDRSFSDGQLTPGPATMPLQKANSYALTWSGAFVQAGSATLQVKVIGAKGAVSQSKSVTVKGKAGDVFFRVVLLP